VALLDKTLWWMLYETAAAHEILALDVADLDLANRKAKVRRKGGAADIIIWAGATACLLPRLMKGLSSEPLFLTGRRARLRSVAARDCPTGRARRSSGAATRDMPGSPLTLQLLTYRGTPASQALPCMRAPVQRRADANRPGATQHESAEIPARTHAGGLAIWSAPGQPDLLDPGSRLGAVDRW
jgi:hypothetical protein